MSKNKRSSFSKKDHLLVKKLLPVVLLIILVCVASFLLTRYFLVRELPTISEPNAYAKSFNLNGHTEAVVKLRCGFFAISCEGHESFVSPYFPHIELKGELIDSQLTHWRTLWYDPIWNVYWIGVQDETLGPNQHFFGPYKSK
jgi:hypothetical protein